MGTYIPIKTKKGMNKGVAHRVKEVYSYVGIAASKFGTCIK